MKLIKSIFAHEKGEVPSSEAGTGTVSGVSDHGNSAKPECQRFSAGAVTIVGRAGAIVKIEHGIAVPPPVRKRPLYPLAQMEPGESFLVPVGWLKNPQWIKTHANKKHAPKKFVGRIVDGGYRIWRVQ